MTKHYFNKYRAFLGFTMASLIFAGCTKSDRSAALDSLSPVAESPVTPATPMSVSFTTPVADSTLTTSSVLFQWSATGGAARTNNPYEVKVYSAANCAGAAASTGFVSSAQYTLTGLLHGAVKSVGITAYNTANTASTEVCSSSVTGNSLISTLQVPGATYLALDVDMSAGIVYVGASYGTTFFESIDISNETTPVLLKSVGASTTPSGLVPRLVET